MKPIYEEMTSELGGSCIKATYENGIVLLIPMDEANSDYQAYLNKDKQQVEHLTEIIPSADKAI